MNFKSINILTLFKRYLFILIIPLALSFELKAQCGEDAENSVNGITWDFDEKTDGFSIVNYISGIFTPQIISDTRKIRTYVRDARFQILRVKCGDLRAVDAIFLKSLKYAEYNIARALFLSLMAVLEHRKVELKIPIIESLELPLTFEDDSTYLNRTKNLPTQIFPDSPKDTNGDRDKLQHFFASAYLTYAAEAPQFTKTVGDLVEWGEAKFVVGGADDSRDKLANKLGERFGKDLLVVKTLLPSDYLTFQTEERK